MGQWILVLVLLFFLGPLLITNLWGYLESRRYLTASALRNTQNVAALQAAEVRGFVTASKDRIRGITAGDAALIDLLRRRGEPGDARNALHTRLAALAAEAADVIELQLLAPDTSLLASSIPGDARADLSSAACFQHGRGGLRAVGLSPDEAYAGESPHLLLAAPVTDGGRMLGVLCARLRLPVQDTLVAAARDRVPGATLYLVDGDGAILFAAAGGVPAPRARRPDGWPDSARFARAEPWAERTELDIGDAVAAHAPIDELGWGVVVGVPVREALSDLERLKWQAIGASAGLVAVMAVALWLAWRTLIRPLRQLHRAAERIAAGGEGAGVTPAGPREVAELAAAFNRMNDTLDQSHRDLERRIAIRTAALRESEDFLDLVLDSIDQRVLVMDRGFRILKANQAAIRMHGAELVGSLCYEEFEGRTAPCDGCPARHTFASSAHATAERSQHTARGRQAVRIETYPVPGSSGEVGSVVSISRVVTEEKQLQAKMAYQEKMAAFGQLTAGIAHEIGNPLAAIDSQLRLAQEDPAVADRTMPVVRKEVARMSRLLRELVDFARRKRDQVSVTSVNRVVDDVVRLLEHDPRAGAVDLQRSLGEGLPGVRAVEDHLVQVLLNLGLNALDATGGAGRIVFETAAENGAVVIRVRDDGPGIPAPVRDRLFEPFFTTKEHGRGTGLGLFVSRSIIHDLGGRLELESSEPGRTTFVVRLVHERPAGEPP